MKLLLADVEVFAEGEAKIEGFSEVGWPKEKPVLEDISEKIKLVYDAKLVRSAGNGNGKRMVCE